MNDDEGDAFFQDDIERLQPYAFLMLDDFSNRRTSCRSRFIPRLDLDKWREPSRNSASFKEDPKGGILLQEEEEELDAPVQNSAFLALKKVSSLFSNREVPPPPAPAQSPILPPLNPLSAYYLHTPEVPSRPYFGGVFRTTQPRNKLQTFIESISKGEDFSPTERNDDDEYIITQDKMSIREDSSNPFTSEVPKQLTREQYFRFYDLEFQQEEGEQERSYKDSEFVEALFSHLLKNEKDDDDFGLRWSPSENH